MSCCVHSRGCVLIAGTVADLLSALLAVSYVAQFALELSAPTPVVVARAFAMLVEMTATLSLLSVLHAYYKKAANFGELAVAPEANHGSRTRTCSGLTTCCALAFTSSVLVRLIGCDPAIPLRAFLSRTLRGSAS